ncbi:V-type proton ATPase subunit E-like [Macrosteles quadrilineatus]|uniref:V-type proton ATPase subunit E-like n=1 Tax=Macrosteles quadrilineatus TaxID=74068 RepID=UPI0023E33F56|nr:V-type proton ATPase subunit E-like [Macrosteles quadrilineatus]
MAAQKEYENKLQIMVDYIEQDGHEKAEEIDVMAEEEYYIEKKNYIEKRIGAVKKYYDNLEKKFQQQMVLDISKLKSQSYRNVMNSRNMVVENILKTVLDRLNNLDYPDNECLYKKVLFELTLQGLLQIMEPRVVLQVRKNDLPLIKKVTNQAQNVFHSLTGMNVSVTVEESEFLSAKGKGGVILYTKSKSVSVNNTLEKKLEQMTAQLLPRIREIVFGKNPNRRHND